MLVTYVSFKLNKKNEGKNTFEMAFSNLQNLQKKINER